MAEEAFPNQDMALRTTLQVYPDDFIDQLTHPQGFFQSIDPKVRSEFSTQAVSALIQAAFGWKLSLLCDCSVSVLSCKESVLLKTGVITQSV
jgi:hypothetical protein